MFGCLANTHVKQGKLEPRAKKCLFIDYPTDVKGYKLWTLEPEGPRTIVTRDVTFDESTTMKLGNKKTQHDLEEKRESMDVEILGIGAGNSIETSRDDRDLNE